MPTKKKRNVLTNTYDQNNMEGTLSMLARHMPKFAQLETVWQELSSRNIDIDKPTPLE
jgi:hypothetical protein